MKAARYFNLISLVTLISILIAPGCSGNFGTSESTATQIPPTRTPFPPSPTPIPTAAIVNGDLITLAEYQEELARYKAAVNRDLTDEDQEIVIHDLINLTLLAQAAKTEGYQVSDEDLEERITALNTEDQPLDDWLAAHGFTSDSFRVHLKRAIKAAWMRDKIIADVPYEMVQIHAQQMLFYELEPAQQVLEELEEGKDFSDLAKNYDPQTQGDLGWFPPNFLTLPVLDPVLFNLEIGETSDIIETDIGYHIIKILEKEDNRPLDPAIRQVLQAKAIDSWLERRWKLSSIQITLPE
jgi:parvulin-like peptidyl-prolyl isomerase